LPKTLVIAEKPSVARDIARVLKCGKQGEGCVSSDEYIVTWAVGHLLTLCEPEDYDEALKRWRADALPIIPNAMKLKPIPAVKSQLGAVKKLMNSPEVDGLICATDSGREGELIFRYIYEYTKCKKPFRRLWISSMTDAAIRGGFASLKDGAEYDNLYNAARCRSEADWLVGINATRAYTLKYNALLSIGRVQTPTLALLAARQAEIESFKPADYWEVTALFGLENGEEYGGTWFDAKTKSTHIETAEQAAQILEVAAGQAGTVESVETSRKSQPPPLLYDLTELQRDCVRRFGFSAQRTLDIAQDLYEKHKVITYPRTDSRYLSADMEPKAVAVLQKLAGLYPAEIAAMPPVKTPFSRRVTDDAKVTDHHAIIPNGHTVNPAAMTPDERRVFDLIARRFISVFYPDYVTDNMKAVTLAGGERFLSRGTAVVRAGWNALYQHVKTAEENDGDDSPALPPLAEGARADVLHAQSRKKQTKPPPFYNEATLLSAMEHAGRTVENDSDDNALQELMKASSLGTPATRAAIIERLLAVGYISRRGKTLVVLEKGMKLIRILPGELISPITTGKWEKGLDSIARGNMDPARFMESIGRFVRYIVAGTDVSDPDVRFEEERRGGRGAKKHAAPNVIGACPACGGDILENSKAFYCGRWRDGCDYKLWKSNLPVGSPEEQRAEVKNMLKNAKSDNNKNKPSEAQNGKARPKAKTDRAK